MRASHGSFDTQSRGPRSNWTFLTNHTHVLLCVTRDPNIRLRDVATMVGITERAAQSIVADLEGEGYLTRSRVGRRNVYVVHHDHPLRTDDNGSLTVGGLLDFLQSHGRRIDFAPTGLAASGTAHTSGRSGVFSN